VIVTIFRFQINLNRRHHFGKKYKYSQLLSKKLHQMKTFSKILNKN
jgi:hypothetical protein